MTLIGWAGLGGMPILGLLRLALKTGWAQVGSIPAAPERLRRFVDPPVLSIAANSLLLGLEVASIVFLVAWLVPRGSRPRSARPASTQPAPTIAGLPPLVQGVGILAIPWLAGLGAEKLGHLTGWERMSHSLEKLAEGLGPYRNPEILLAGSVLIVVGIPLLRTWWRSTEFDHIGNRTQFEAALIAGGTQARARLLAASLGWGRWLGWFVMVWGYAATNLAPALLFTPWMDGRTLLPAILALADTPDEGRLQAAALGLCALGVNLTALAAGRVSSSWPRGVPPGPL
jgi:hypothetical protein